MMPIRRPGKQKSARKALVSASKLTKRKLTRHAASSLGTPRLGLIVGISGASGAIYGVRLLETLRRLGIQSHLVMSKAAEMTISYEIDRRPADVKALADVVYPIGDLGAPISSGSFPTMGMIIAPCSVRSLAEIATGVTSSLLTRAADVILKERRKLVLMVRETPLHLGHLRAMTQLAEMGAIIAPPVPGFYSKPETILDLVDHSVDRVLDLLGLPSERAQRWDGGSTN